MSDKQTITLCMIVKNEKTDHFRQCLESVKKHIDYYVICDTGSTDGTQDFIREFFDEAGIQGEVHDIPWEGFGKCRSKALELCDGKADYAWMIDADDYLEGDFQLPDIMMDSYQLRIKRGNFEWWRNQIFKTGRGWKYVGVLHEYAYCDGVNTGEIKQGRIATPGYYIEARTLGARNIDENKQAIDAKTKYLRDASVLLSALTNPDDPNYEPQNDRYHFYLAQSYFDSQEWASAREWYLKRAEMGGWEEEVFYSLYRYAICGSIVHEQSAKTEGPSFPETVQEFMNAWNYRPGRAEPIYQLARIYRALGKNAIAYMYAQQANKIPFPQNDILFLPKEQYDWQMEDELASTAFYVGEYQEGYDAAMRLLQKNLFPESERQRIMTNLEQYQLAMQQIAMQQQQMEQHQVELNQQIEKEREADKQDRVERHKQQVQARTKAKNRKKRKQSSKARKAQRT